MSSIPHRAGAVWLLLAAALAALAPLGCALLAPGRGAGDRLFEAGELGAAEAAYREALRADPAGAGQDRALFRLALIYALPDSPLHDLDAPP